MAARPRAAKVTAGRSAYLFVRTALVLVLLLVAAAMSAAGGAAASSSPAPTESQPLVNWTWLAVGLGGVVILLAIMFVLTRFMGRGRRDGE